MTMTATIGLFWTKMLSQKSLLLGVGSWKRNCVWMEVIKYAWLNRQFQRTHMSEKDVLTAILNEFLFIPCG